MELFAEELVRFTREWPVWTVVALDEKKRTISVDRRDEFPMSLQIRVSATYPSGKSTIQNKKTKSVYTFNSNERLSEAIDNALQSWSNDSELEDEGFRDSSGQYLCDDGAYSEALFAPTSKTAQPDEAARSGQMHRKDNCNFAANRLLVLWRALAEETRPPCRADVFEVSQLSDSRSILLNLSLSIRDVDAFLSLALGLQHAEYLTVAIHIPFNFPVGSPVVKQILLCNHPDVQGEIEDEKDDKLGALSWFLTDRINPLLHRVTLSVRSTTLSEGNSESSIQGHDTTGAPIVVADRSREFGDTGLDQWPLLGSSFLTYEQITGTIEEVFSEHVRLLANGDNLIRYFARKFHSLVLNSLAHCFVCGDPLTFGGMQLTNCAKELCTFGVERIGLGVDILSEITKRPEVFELLMLFTSASAANAEKRDTFIPMCSVDISHRGLEVLATYRGPLNFFQNDGKTKNFRLIIEVLQQIPSVATMSRLSNGGSNHTLRRALDKVHPLVYPFAQWILASNRSHIQFVPQMYHVRGMGPHQYLIINHNARREQGFRMMKAAAAKQRGGSGSFFAWHGSATGNWHCILREGLRVYSGTKLMSSGQVYGAGIYLARTISTSIPYMGASKGCWANSNRFNSPSGCTVLALCEVVDNPDIFSDHNNDIITVSDEESICTRFLFVFAGAHGPPSFVVNSLPANEDIAAQLSAACSFLL